MASVKLGVTSRSDKLTTNIPEMLVKGRIETIRARRLIQVHTEECFFVVSLGKRSKKDIVILIRYLQLDKVNNVVKISMLNFKERIKIVHNKFTDTGLGLNQGAIFRRNRS